jgi:ubiquinone/menaquinone biosynthesis C-methylase UbiE
MADSRDEKVWTNHSKEQWEENKTGHEFSDGDLFRVKLLSLEGVEKVVDLGCGGGLWRKLFLGFDYTGCDQNASMIEHAKKRFPDTSFVVSNGETLPFDDGSVDLVWTAAVLQHNRHNRKSEVVKEIRRVLKPGGYYFCTENTFREDNYHHTFRNKSFSEDLDDGYSFTKSGWEEYMKGFGFKMAWFELPSHYLFEVQK